MREWLKSLIACKACMVRQEQVNMIISAYESRIIDLVGERDELRSVLYKVMRLDVSNSIPGDARQTENKTNMHSWPSVQRALEIKNKAKAQQAKEAKESADRTEQYWKDKAAEAEAELKKEVI